MNESDPVKCATCEFSHIAYDERGKSYLECRRYAPHMICGAGTGFTQWSWPKVEPHDWCGEGKEKYEA